MMEQFPIFGPALGMGIYAPYPNTTAAVRRNPSDIPLNIGANDYGTFCDPQIRYLTPQCSDQFPYRTGAGQYQPGNNYAIPLGAPQGPVTPQRRPYPFFEWAFMGQFQNQYPDTQYPDTKTPYGIDKVYGPSFNEWVTGPWLAAITQEVYQQYNAPLLTPFGL